MKLLFLLFWGTLVVSAQQGTAPKPGPPVPPGTGGPGGTSRADQMQKFLAIGDRPDPEAVKRGKATFVATCGFCHGANANGGESGPDLVRSVIVLHDNNGDSIGPVIHAGRAGKMPAFPAITQQQISEIAAFLKSRYQAAANRGSYEIQNINTGDAKAGEAFFSGAGRCNTCHSPSGDLAGIAKKYQPDALQSRFLYPRAHKEEGEESGNEKVASTATVTLRDGQKVSGRLEYIDDFSVALHDQTGAYHAYDLNNNNGIKVEVQDPLAAHQALLKKYTNTDMHNMLSYLETLQ